VPAQIGSATTWAIITAGAKHSVAIKNDGSLWSWGDNRDGQLGLGINQSQFNPIPIDDAKIWKTVSAGQFHTIGIRSDGTLWVWGRNLEGQFGDGKQISSNRPINVP